jgi:hypothetical protein
MDEPRRRSGGGPTMDQFQALRGEVADLDQKFDRRFGELDERFVRLDEKVNRVASVVARLEGDMTEVRRDVSEMKGLRRDFGRFQSVLDGMARSMESFERWTRSQGSMLLEHEERLGKLERKLQ